MDWWRKLHPGIRILLGACLMFGLAKGALEILLPYRDDPETVRHRAARAGLIRGESQQAAAGLDGGVLLKRCTCAGDRFAASLTSEQLKPLESHQEGSAPPFTITPAMQAQVDNAIRACLSAP